MELRRFAFLNLFVALFGVGGIIAFAQSNRGSISGSVTDLTGGVVPNATVIATETNTGTTYNTVTSQSGNYNFPQLLVGNYEITVSTPGFNTEKRTGIVVQINSTTVLNVQVSVGQTAETITVSADVPTVRSTSSEIGGCHHSSAG